MSARRDRGFTLLEVVVALAILAISLMAIFNMNAGAIAMHAYVKKLTVATLLARSKMTDIEQKLYDKGFNADDEEDGGDFSEEGWPTFKWRVKILAPKTDGISPEQVIGAIFNIPLGMGTSGDSLAGASSLGGSSSGGGGLMDSLSSLLGGGGLGGLAGLLGGSDGGTGGLSSLLGGAGGGAAGGTGGILSMLGPLAGTQFQQMVDQITKAVREVHLTVSWKEGKTVESIDLVTHVVSMGPGGDRNGLVQGGQSMASATSGQPPPNPVDAVTGAPVPNPQPGPNGSWINPATGNQVVSGGAGATNPMQNVLNNAGTPATSGALGQPQLNRGPPAIFPGLGNPPFFPPRPGGH